MNISDPKNSRRDFLSRILAAWGTLTSLPFIYGVARYVYPPIKKEGIADSIIAAGVTELPINTAKIVRFNKQPVILVHTAQGQFKSFTATCTHLGCIIEYRSEDERFHCNCHGSIFDLNGKNVGGPAPAPLLPIKTSLKDSQVVLSIPLS